MDFAVSDELLGTIVVYWVCSGLYMMMGSMDGYRLHSRQDEDVKNSVTKSAVRCFAAAYSGCCCNHAVFGSDSEAAATPTSILSLARQFFIAMLVMIHGSISCIDTCITISSSTDTSILYTTDLLSPMHLMLYTITPSRDLSPRTSSFFFSFATIKTVDDHRGLWLPCNLFHVFFKNNTAYHDVHHQLYGSKYNFSQLFFVTWDKILGTHIPYSLLKRAEGGFEVQPTKVYKGD